MAKTIFDWGFNIGYREGKLDCESDTAIMQPSIETKCPSCPPCDCSYNVPLQNNDIGGFKKLEREQELDDARREQYYLDQNMNRHR